MRMQAFYRCNNLSQHIYVKLNQVSLDWLVLQRNLIKIRHIFRFFFPFVAIFFSNIRYGGRFDFFSPVFISYFVYAYVYVVSIERFVSLDHMSASISFDIHAIIIRISLSFHPACTRKRTSRAATRPIIFAVPLSSSHHICFPSRARTLDCGVGRNSLVPHTHTNVSFSSFSSR